jgi:hypothetical protein
VTHAAEQPEKEKHDEDQADDPAKAPRAVASMSVIAPAAAKQQDEHNDNKDEAQGFTCVERVVGKTRRQTCNVSTV